MSSETDHPRQRTVAELLAQHGDANATGRRRRRREPDGSEEGGAAPVGRGAPAVPDWPAPSREPDRALLRERVPPGQRDSGGRRSADREPGSWEPEPPSWESRRAPEPQARDSAPQPWDSGPQAWESTEWDAPARDDRRDAQPPPRQTREREQRGWEPEPPGPEPRAWDSGPQAWDSRPREPQPREAQIREPQIREPQIREPQIREPQIREPQIREPQIREPQIREPQIREPQIREPQIREPQIRESQPRETPPRGAAAGSPVRDRPTDHIPRVRDEDPALDVSLTAPIQPHLRPGADGYESNGYESNGYESNGYDSDGYDSDGYDDDDDDGPPTMVGAAPAGAEAWHRDRTRGRQNGAQADEDVGPPTEAAAPLDFDDEPAGLGGRRYDQSDSFSDGFEDFYGGGQDELPPVHRPDRARNGRARRDRDQRFDDAEPEPGGFFDSEESEAVEDDEQPGKSRRKWRAGAVADNASQAWAAVLAQWIAGAVGGAALWVGFRFLWRSLPVVALAAAVLVTVGLVVVVRALLRNNDMRTTMFAVLVGLLLTASPAILVLLGR
ncbi:hypothetical protein [Pseudonocardia aurantiaca]|uniref:Uncharacterized protein n=1 Tax=Pseudonocardia aurantiaca TaxID=75290 RepID=A0ABW4FW15_9PSEU